MDEHSAADRERIRAALNNLDAELLKMIDIFIKFLTMITHQIIDLVHEIFVDLF